MEQNYRDQYALFFDTTPSGTSKNYVLEGTGVDSLAFSFNPQVDQYKTIIDRNASATFKNYQIQSSVSGKRIYKGDKIYEFLNEARKKATAIETTALEVDTAEESSEGSYVAIEYNVLIVINEFLGEDATISYDLYVKGTPTLGTATLSDGVPTFTKSA